MKTIIPFIFFTCSTIYSFGQLTEEDLDYNNAAATVGNSGSFFTSAQNGAGYEVPKGGGVDAIYTSQFWFAARDINGTVYTSLGGNGQNTDVDQGPYSTSNSYSDPDYDKPYMITLCQEEIDQFNLWWECENGIANPDCATAVEPSSDVLNSIYGWPANGDPSLGQAFQLAPFFDRDGDGTYNPIASGDYPLIKGCCATYMIQNDQGNPHTVLTSGPMGIEMHYLFYQFGANTDLYNTTFVDVMVINRGTQNYPEFALSFMADADLGSPVDDYFGSDSTTNTMIFYNADNLDEGGYLDNPPAIGVTALELPSTSIMSFGFAPSTPVQAWNLSNGLQPNGAPILDPNGDATTFLAYGDPNDPTQWNETSAGYIAGDRRGLNTTKIQSFNSGDTLLQSYAIVYAEGGNHLENASNVINLASWAKTFYDTEIDNGCEAGGIAITPVLNAEQILIYPNPNNGTFIIESPNAQVKSIQIFDLAGKEVGFTKEGSLVWNVSLQSAASGVYIINVQTETGIIVERLVVE
ncbi:MAG: T9SS type A sorting domain-containing protein [Crocinitomicaceae bacterium]